MNAAAAQRIEIDRQSSDQRFTFAGLHFGNLALMENHSADQLHVEVPHVEDTAAGFASDGKGLFEYFLQDPVCGFPALFVDFLLPLEVGFWLIRNAGETLGDALAEFV